MKFRWEDIDYQHCESITTERAKVIDGWLVRTYEPGVGISMIFIRDPDHDWEIEE